MKRDLPRLTLKEDYGQLILGDKTWNLQGGFFCNNLSCENHCIRVARAHANEKDIPVARTYMPDGVNPKLLKDKKPDDYLHRRTVTFFDDIGPSEVYWICQDCDDEIRAVYEQLIKKTTH